MTLVKIKEEYHKRRMKETGDEFMAKKLGEAWYLIKESNGNTYRHLAVVVEKLSELVVEGEKNGNCAG